MKVQNGSSVSVHYRGTLNNGTVFDDSKHRGTALHFQVGAGQMIPGFDEAIVGMKVGETKTIHLTSEEAYGPRNPEAVQAVPKPAFGPDFEFLVGEVVQGNGPQGPFLAKILEEREEDVLLDFNHPLAGEDLTFDIELVAANDEDETQVQTQQEWTPSMLKSELFTLAKSKGLDVNSKSTKAQIIAALQTA
tara:strand:+ start:37 stop:609 length:573 start_codon:yes stop_codon:yes gene_type:complete